MVHKRSLSPVRDEVSVKRCRHDVMAKLTDKFTLHRGRLHQSKSYRTTNNDNPAADDDEECTASTWQQRKTRLRYVNNQDRNFYVAALYTLTSNLGLQPETIHMCISLLDRFLKVQPITLEWLEVVSVSCIWLAAKFNETQTNLEKLRVKKTLQQRQGHGKGNWTWHHVLVLECQILKRLGFRILHPTILSSFYDALASGAIELTDTQLDDALYFVDLSLMDVAFQAVPVANVVDAIAFLVTEFQPDANFSIGAIEERLRDPVLRFVLLHMNLDRQDKDLSSAIHQSVVCKHNARLSKSWRHADVPSCACRICQSID
ncbi:unnamed protein product [Aphanomyces euteiches]|uniref:Cyclin N-terminal domain-containing protein n=1 Tax=Aphanomyces euteiches TaxID=100861 RepID=A0A6G0WQB9_9STRA|nr:hypothetical protein Ae201684_012886 [Aphanomyces euteiches]KAH9097497.1 hypothetical protein Ae201684P_000975 [Aphanomyces euteiches]KAH9133296.1 hypothetical protein AeRB84_020607 [Aphanomyces euteiches]